MAYAIGFHCTACGLCSSTCPNDAIRGPYPHYYIEPLLCTECALFADTALCAEICPSHAIEESPLMPGQRWMDMIPVRAIHPALRKTRLQK